MSEEWAEPGPPPEVPQNVKPKMKPQQGAGSGRGRRSRSISWERRRRRGRGREREREEGRRRRGRSQEARGRHGGAGSVSGESESECPVCFCSYDNGFKAPKLLLCGHTFCLECLARINVSSVDVAAVSCPVCRHVTPLPHGRDLPRLQSDDTVLRRLPPAMRRPLSVRFQRSKGKLLLKAPPPPAAAAELTVKDSGTAAEDQGEPSPAVLDVGRPPSRVRSRLRRLFRSDRCYYAVVGGVITITVTLMLVGILAFIIVPRVSRPPQGPPPPPGGGNQTGTP